MSDVKKPGGFDAAKFMAWEPTPAESAAAKRLHEVLVKSIEASKTLDALTAAIPDETLLRGAIRAEEAEHMRLTFERAERERIKREELARLQAAAEFARAQAKSEREAPAVVADGPLKADRGPRVKRKALIERNRRRWPTIERDLQDASSNGLSAEAKANGTGFWWEGDALRWAEVRDKLEAPPAALGLVSVVHRMVG